MMRTLTTNEIIDKINAHECFEATVDHDGFSISIREYTPFIATAIHAGSNFDSALKSHCQLTETERYFEEDPFTDHFITGLPITLIAHDSRYAYDLNRTLDSCIYDTAWGKAVWHTPLTDKLKNTLIAKHASYYEVLSALVTAIESMHQKCCIIDVHSYNYQRIADKVTPVFNIGTHFINKRKWHNTLKKFSLALLTEMDIPNIETTVEHDLVFYGRAHQAEFIHTHFKNTLLIPLEVKKIYMDELSGEHYPLVIEAIAQGLQSAIYKTMEGFSKTPRQARQKNKGMLDKGLLAFDKRLFQLSRKIDVLNYVNPINFHTEKKKFFQKRGDYEPKFHYRQLKINPFEFREKLYHLPLHDVESPALRQLYCEVIDSIALDVDLLTSVGKDEFFYNSLRIYGEPSNRDIANANFLLHAPDITKPCKTSYEGDEIINAFEEVIQSYQIDFKIKLSDQIIAKAMVDNGKKEVVINKNAKFNHKELQALIHHEVGVHALTTINAESQPLSLLRLGLPNNTHTQEGLAIFSEYLSGNLTIKRLHELALRVIAVEHMIKHMQFSKTYHYLRSISGLESHACFRLVARVYRGGGFSKDFLYLSGLREIIDAHQRMDINLLFTGKTSLKYLDSLHKIANEGYLIAPKLIPVSYQSPTVDADDQIIRYLMQSIK